MSKYNENNYITGEKPDQKESSSVLRAVALKYDQSKDQPRVVAAEPVI